jgi:hypothetical protein
MNRIFINYRRQDSLPYADRLQEALGEHYGSDEVFRDVDTIEPGLDFMDAIERALNQSKVVLVLIGSHWLVDRDGRSRLQEPDDYVRLEIAAALRRTDVRVIPVLVGGGTMPSPDDLPQDLTSLTRRNAFEMTDARWRFDRDELLRRLDRALGNGKVAQPPEVAQPPSPVLPPPAPQPPTPQTPDRARPFVVWGWILTGASLLIPFLALGAIVLGALVISRGGGRRTGMGIGIIVAAIVVGLFSISFWTGV